MKTSQWSNKTMPFVIKCEYNSQYFTPCVITSNLLPKNKDELTINVMTILKTKGE